MSESPGKRVTVDVVIPVLNEAHVLAKSVAKVRAFLSKIPDWQCRVVVVDNGSTDGTDDIAKRLESEHKDVSFLWLSRPGRGGALRYSWLRSEADVVCYMDVDLSTELTDLPKLVGAVAREGYDLATGSRLLPDSATRRSWKREFISRMYNWTLRAYLGVGFSDAQCGFKAASRRAVEQVVPLVEDQSWFFDTEMLVLAERSGLRIADIPIRWVEDDDSRVKILKTAWDDIKGMVRVKKRLRAGVRAARGVRAES